MAGTLDHINELIEIIEQSGHDFVIGIIKTRTDNSNIKDIDIYTNKTEDGLDKLLSVLSKNKSQKAKKKNKVIDKPHGSL